MDPVLVQSCCGIPYGAPADSLTVNALPHGATSSASSIGRFEMSTAALAAILGGNVRVGLDDNVYLARGALATSQLIDRAVSILEGMNARILGAGEARQRLSLRDPSAGDDRA